jgi:hypothetical protein
MARRKRKSEQEARVERVTWFLLVLIFALLSIVPEENLPDPFVPLSGAIILLGSGIYQYTHRWHVSPVTWIAGMLMLFLTILNIYVGVEENFLGFSLLVFAGVIGFGVLTGET